MSVCSVGGAAARRPACTTHWSTANSKACRSRTQQASPCASLSSTGCTASRHAFQCDSAGCTPAAPASLGGPQVLGGPPAAAAAAAGWSCRCWVRVLGAGAAGSCCCCCCGCGAAGGARGWLELEASCARGRRAGVRRVQGRLGWAGWPRRQHGLRGRRGSGARQRAPTCGRPACAPQLAACARSCSFCCCSPSTSWSSRATASSRSFMCLCGGGRRAGRDGGAADGAGGPTGAGADSGRGEAAAACAGRRCQTRRRTFCLSLKRRCASLLLIFWLSLSLRPPSRLPSAEACCWCWCWCCWCCCC
jgi:hypothetical protein